MLSNVVLVWPGGQMRAASLAPGVTSDYEGHEGAYRYGALDVTINGSVRHLQPIDYVGESPLQSGRYTYVIVVPQAGPLSIDLQLVREP